MDKNFKSEPVVSYGESVIRPAGLKEIPFREIVRLIKENQNLKNIVESIRNTSDKKKRKAIKEELPYFNMGLFKGSRSDKNIKTISHLLFDIDDLDKFTLFMTRSRLTGELPNTSLPERLPHIMCVFVSPSGNGLKFIVPFDRAIRNKIDYTDVYEYYREHYENLLGLDLDGSTKDMSRPCFLSSDLRIYYNPSAPAHCVDEALAKKRTEREREEKAKEKKAEEARKVVLSLEKNCDNSQMENKIKGNIIDQILNIISLALDGERHAARLKAGRLAGGAIAGGILNESEIIPLLEDAVMGNTDSSREKVIRTVKEAIEHGKRDPLNMENEIGKYMFYCQTIEDIPLPFMEEVDEENDHFEPPDEWFEITEEEVAKKKSRINGKKSEDSGKFKKYHLTELGNSQRFLDNYRHVVRFNHTSKKWHVWDGKRWKEDQTAKAEYLAKSIASQILLEATRAKNSKRKQLVRHSLASESHKVIANTLKLATSDQGISVLANQLDKNKYLFNVANKTIQLTDKGYEIREHKQNHLISKIANVSYDETAISYRWNIFLKEIFRKNNIPDEELISFIQKAVSLSLTGNTSEQYLFFCYGTGRNGKSTFFEVLKALFGDYYQKAPTEMLMIKRGCTNIPNDIARLVGTRFVVASEIEKGRRLAESVVKDLTGGDTITARFLRQEYFDFEPTHKLWIYGNHKPMVRSIDDGIWRRLLVIPFTEKIEEPDKHLKDRLVKKELPGILNWCLEGYKKWREEGFKIPASVRMASKEYQDEMNNVSQFLDDCCERDATKRITVKKLFETYSCWCTANREAPVKKKEFKERLIAEGFNEPRRETDNKLCWCGICLNQETITDFYSKPGFLS